MNKDPNELNDLAALFPGKSMSSQNYGTPRRETTYWGNKVNSVKQ